MTGSNARSSSHPSMIALGCLYEEMTGAWDRVTMLRSMASPKASACHESTRDKKVEESGNTANGTKASLRQFTRSIPLTVTS